MFEERLRDALVLVSTGLTSQAVKEYSGIIEQALEKFYCDIWAHLNSDEKQRLVSIERSFSKKRTPIETLGLGKWIEFFKEAEMPSLLYRYLDIDPSVLDYGILELIKEARNKCTHEEYRASQEEVDTVRRFAVKLLVESNLIKAEPVEIRPVSEEAEARSEVAILADRIRLLLAGNPCFRFQDHIEKDMGQFYDVLARWEFVGVFCLQGEIHIMVNEVESSYHDDVAEDVYNELGGLIESTIKINLLEIKNIRIQIDIALREANWGEAADTDIEAHL